MTGMHTLPKLLFALGWFSMCGYACTQRVVAHWPLLPFPLRPIVHPPFRALEYTDRPKPSPAWRTWVDAIAKTIGTASFNSPPVTTHSSHVLKSDYQLPKTNTHTMEVTYQVQSTPVILRRSVALLHHALRLMFSPLLHLPLPLPTSAEVDPWGIWSSARHPLRLPPQPPRCQP